MDPVEVVGKERLSEARRLLDALNKRQFVWTAAAWVHIPEANEWRLVVAFPMMQTEGAQATYEKVGKVLQEERIAIPIYGVAALRPSDPIFPAVSPQAAPASAKLGTWWTVPVASTTTITSAIGALAPDHVVAYSTGIGKPQSK